MARQQYAVRAHYAGAKDVWLHCDRQADRPRWAYLTERRYRSEYQTMADAIAATLVYDASDGVSFQIVRVRKRSKR